MLADNATPFRVRDLFPGAEYLPAGCDPIFTSVRTRADLVAPGDLYVHLDEFDSSGARQAVERGAAAVVAERLLPEIGAPLVIVDDSRAAARVLQSLDAAPTTDSPRLIAVAGASGGDRTATLLALIQAHTGHGVGLLIGRVDDDGEHAVPRDRRARMGSQQWLNRCRLGGVESAILHANPLDDETPQTPAAVCLTSLRCDGLDGRGDRRWNSASEHRNAILATLGTLTSRTTLVASADDPDAMAFAAEHTGPLLTFGDSPHADVHATVALDRGDEFIVSYENDSACVTAPAPGRAARRDTLAAIATALALGGDLRVAAVAIGSAPQLALHTEAVSFGQPFSIRLDAAVRPLALADALDAARPQDGRLLLTLRLAKDRRVAQRQLDAAARMADRVFACGDVTGVQAPSDRVTLVGDPHAAIAVTIGLADAGDAVLVAGCRERLNELGDWDCPERHVVRELVERRLAHEDRRAAA